MTHRTESDAPSQPSAEYVPEREWFTASDSTLKVCPFCYSTALEGEVQCISCGQQPTEPCETADDGDATFGVIPCVNCGADPDVRVTGIPGRQPAPAPDALRAVIERDRSKVAAALVDVHRVLRGHDWLAESRGSYEWDDDRWHDEFRRAWDAMRKVIAPLEEIARDWGHCPTTQSEVDAARAVSAPTGEPSDAAGRTPDGWAVRDERGHVDLSTASEWLADVEEEIAGYYDERARNFSTPVALYIGTPSSSTRPVEEAEPREPEVEGQCANCNGHAPLVVCRTCVEDYSVMELSTPTPATQEDA